VKFLSEQDRPRPCS